MRNAIIAMGILLVGAGWARTACGETLTVELGPQSRVEIPARDGYRQQVVQVQQVGDMLVVGLQEWSAKSKPEASLLLFRNEAWKWSMVKAIPLGEKFQRFESLSLENGVAAPEQGLAVYGSSGSDRELRVFRIIEGPALRQVYATASPVGVSAYCDLELRRTLIKIGLQKPGGADRLWQVFLWDGSAFVYAAKYSSAPPPSLEDSYPLRSRRTGDTIYVIPQVIEQVVPAVTSSSSSGSTTSSTPPPPFPKSLEPSSDGTSSKKL